SSMMKCVSCRELTDDPNHWTTTHGQCVFCGERFYKPESLKIHSQSHSFLEMASYFPDVHDDVIDNDRYNIASAFLKEMRSRKSYFKIGVPMSQASFFRLFSHVWKQLNDEN